jgi:cell division protein FtsW (lipid II flippase)
LFLLMVVPTTINETKGTLFLLPIGLLVTLVVGSPPHKRLRVGLSALMLLLVFGSLFVPIYDYFSVRNNPYPYTVESFFSNKKAVGHYLDQGTDLGSRREAGRIDSLMVPLQTLASDPVQLTLGVGIGNGSGSSLGNVYAGAYYELLGRYTNQSSAAAFMVEIGLLGLSLVLLLYWLIFRDAYVVSMQDSSIVGALALGWLGATAVIAVATFYKTVHYFESLSYLFWYFSGLVAAERTRLTLDVRPLAGKTPRRPLALTARPYGGPLNRMSRQK